MLTLEQASSIIMLLATIDENISINSIRIPRLNNVKIYNINSKDGKLSLTISSDELEKLGNHFGKVLEYITKVNDFHIPARENIYEILADVFNHYIDKFNEEYDEQYPENDEIEKDGDRYSRATKFVSALEELKDKSNKTTNEDKIFATAIGLCLTVCDSGEHLEGSDIEDDIAVTERVHESDLEVLRSVHNIDWAYFDKTTNAKLEQSDLEKIKLMVVATISPDTYLEITGYDNLENISDLLFYGLNENGGAYEMFLHDRNCSFAETEILKDKLYYTITDAFDMGEFADKNEHEIAVFEILKEDLQRFGDSYFYDKNLKGIKDMADSTLESNIGRERRLLETFTLTIATLIMELKDHIAQISKEDFDASHLENVIKQNYELVKRDNTIFSRFYGLLKNILNFREEIRNRLENGEVVYEEILEKLDDSKLALKNALADLVGIDSIPGNFDDLLTLNEDTLEEGYDEDDYDDEYDEDYDKELDGLPDDEDYDDYDEDYSPHGLY